MTLSDLVKEQSWNDLRKVLKHHYSIKKRYLTEFEKVFIYLKTIIPKKSKFSIILNNEIDQLDNEEYVSVSGIVHSTTIKQEPHPESYALDFTPWNEWLGMAIDKITLENFSHVDIVCHCIYEMTLVSFDQRAIQKRKQEIIAVANEINNMTEEERKKKLIPHDEVMKRLKIDK